MLVDWVTAHLSYEYIQPEDWQKLILMTERVMRFKPNSDDFNIHDSNTGEAMTKDGYFLLNRDSVVYETSAWESVKSDSHQIAFRVGSDAIWIQGSPARVCGSGDAVFGEGASGALDLPACVCRMAVFVSDAVGVVLDSDVTHWKVSRIDVTGNLLLDDISSVREALRVLRNCEGGRYRVSQQAGDTVYWSHKSRLRSGKAYAKGPHIEYQTTKKGYSGRIYSEYEKKSIMRLLRLELSLKSQWLRERSVKKWWLLTANDLKNEWHSYFMRMIGDSEMLNENDLKNKIELSAKTEGQAKSAYSLFLLIKSVGWEVARSETSKPTWYRNIKILRQAGLGDADIATGNIVPFRRKIIECQMVNSWDELHRLVA